MIVLDTSAALDLLITPQKVPELRLQLHVNDVRPHAPEALITELFGVVRRSERTGEITADEAFQRLARFLSLQVRTHSHASLMPRIWNLRHNFTIEDAAFVALAEYLACPLATTDRGLARAVRQFVPKVQLL